MKYLSVSFLLFITSCVSSPANTCLPLKTWSNHDQDVMEAQLDVLPPDSPLIQAMTDYAKMRAETVACEKAMEN